MIRSFFHPWIPWQIIISIRYKGRIKRTRHKRDSILERKLSMSYWGNIFQWIKDGNQEERAQLFRLHSGQHNNTVWGCLRNHITLITLTMSRFLVWVWNRKKGWFGWQVPERERGVGGKKCSSTFRNLFLIFSRFKKTILKNMRFMNNIEDKPVELCASILVSSIFI